MKGYKKGQNPRVTCKQCQKLFTTYLSEIRAGKGKFCSKKCVGLWMRKNRVGENSARWRGDEVGYRAVHCWIEKCLGKPKFCEDCKRTTTPKGKTRYFQWANLDGKYSRDIKTWKRLCTKCHAALDAATRRKAKGKSL